MSNHLAIATVTATLRQMLADSVGVDVSGTEVTILSPDDPSLKSDAAKLNLYLYQVTPNTAWRNADLPTMRNDGSLSAKPQLAIDLHYLLTAYGKAAKDDPEIHRVLGSALLTLHEQSVLSRDAIRSIVKGNSLAGSDLAEQIEMVKLTPQSLSLEELSKLWSVFFQTPYRISFAYVASVVLLEGRKTPKPSLPVRDRNLYILPFRRPEILGLEPQSVEYDAGAKIVLSGRNMSALHVALRFGGIETAPDSPVTDDRLVVSLPAGLRAGVNTIQVIQRLEMGNPPVAHRGFASNVAAFILMPRIASTPPYSVSRGAVFTLDCEPPVGRSQRVALLVGNHEIDIPARPATGPDETTKLEFAIPQDFPVGSYLMRLRVDGAESVLQVKSKPMNPVYEGPILEVTA